MIRSRNYSVLLPISFAEFWRMTQHIHFADNGCWIWTGTRYDSGYGIVYLRKDQWAIHRLFFEMFRGHIPEGYVVHHRCKCPSCCNPFHLDACTQGDNVRAADTPAGETHYKAALTHCIHGHPLSGDNLYVFYVNGRPRRVCRACARRRTATHRRRCRGGRPCPPSPESANASAPREPPASGS